MTITTSHASISKKPEFDLSLLQGLGINITHVESDSKKIKPGDTFLAFPGERGDGRNYIAQAIAAGANAVIWEAEDYVWEMDEQFPNLKVEFLRLQAGEIASHVYAEPSRQMWVIGVTGTNGKTSCAHWLASSLSAVNKKTALIGTLGNGFYGELSATSNTTPDPVSVQCLLKEYLEQDAKCVAMEVSSHGLVQGRVSGVAFDVALLTNLSRDHLDYHGSMEGYAEAKTGLFEWQGLKYAVLNLDDPFGVALQKKITHNKIKVVGYGLGKGEVSGQNLKLSEDGLELDVQTKWGNGKIKSSMLGAFNASNLLGVLATLLVSGVEFEEAIKQLGNVAPVPGRMQRLGGEDKPLVVVDYAHTPDALAKVLESLREIINKDSHDQAKLICVFGCGGERDKGKRPEMGEIATRLADKVIITSDNPRSENAREIIEQ